MYGIPNMKLPKDVVRRRVELMRASGIEVRCGVDVNDADEGARLLAEFQATIVATGSRRARTLTCEGADLAGVVLAVDYLSDATRALLSHEEPRICARGLDVVVIGGGDTGTDCVATATRQGARSVRQLEFLPEPPRRRRQDNPWPEWPKIRKDDYGQEEAKATYGRDPRQWGTETLAVEDADGHVCGLRTVSLDWSCGRPQRIEGTERTLEARLVLIAMGFVGPEPKALQALGVTCADDPRALPLCDAGTHRASCVHDAPVFVAGDCRTGSTLVVSAIADGIACAREVACALGL
jgi:glutamate synthase (NADPH/NADH) small chain